MKLFHICSKTAYEHLLIKGFLSGDGRRVPKDFKNSYDWMSDQMLHHIGKKPKYALKYPVWCWMDGNHAETSFLEDYDANYVLLELNVDDKDVLVSDFENWHFVLNNWFLSLNEEEYKNFELLEKKLSKKELDKIKKESWKYIFDCNIINKNEIDKEWFGNMSNSLKQACIWVITLDMLENVKILI